MCFSDSKVVLLKNCPAGFAQVSRAQAPGEKVTHDRHPAETRRCPKRNSGCAKSTAPDAVWIR